MSFGGVGVRKQTERLKNQSMNLSSSWPTACCFDSKVGTDECKLPDVEVQLYVKSFEILKKPIDDILQQNQRFGSSIKYAEIARGQFANGYLRSVQCSEMAET